MSNLINIEPNNIPLSEGKIIENIDEESNNPNQPNDEINEEISSHKEEDPAGTTPLPEKYNIKFDYLCKLFAKLGTL